MAGAMLALSLQEPYAWLILQRADLANDRVPLKPIENRNWPLPKDFKVPQRIWIHASLSLYNVTLSELKAIMTASQWFRCKDRLLNIYNYYELYHNSIRDKKWLQEAGYFGCLLGTIVITGQVTESDNPWFFGKWGFTLEYPRLLQHPIPYKGQLKFFEVGMEEPPTKSLQEAQNDLFGGLQVV